MESFRSIGTLVITAPTEAERVYEMAVRLTREDLRAVDVKEFHPWVRLRANVETGDVLIGAGIKVKR